MSTGFIYHDRFLEHETGPTHPERPERLRAICDRLRQDHLWDELTHLPFSPAARKWIARLHSPHYIDRVFAACEAQHHYIDTPDSPISRHSAEIAQLAVGGVLAAVDAVHAQYVHNAFCAVRPPGHHAERDRSMGFCLFNNIAIAAEYLIAHHGYERIAIVDFDVHHGNGTQHLFEDRADVLFISLHEHPSHLYPGTGYVHERGTSAGEDHTLNLPLDPHDGDERYRHVFQAQVLPRLREFAPQFLLLSAGFDAAAEDPLAHMNVSPQGFEWMTRQLKETAESLCNGRLVSALEGGYHLRALAESVSLHVGVLLEDTGHDGMMGMKAGI
ncbi:MAG: histone deacetylase family protein [Phycisphaeraceae bacterium]